MHEASYLDGTSTCQVICALDGVDQNAIDFNGETALDLAINRSKVDSVRALLELNVDTSKARVTATTKVEIVQLFDEHRKRSVKENFCWNNCFLILFYYYRKLNEWQFAIECWKNSEQKFTNISNLKW